MNWCLSVALLRYGHLYGTALGAARTDPAVPALETKHIWANQRINANRLHQSPTHIEEYSKSGTVYKRKSIKVHWAVSLIMAMMNTVNTAMTKGGPTLQKCIKSARDCCQIIFENPLPCCSSVDNRQHQCLRTAVLKGDSFYHLTVTVHQNVMMQCCDKVRYKIRDIELYK